MTLALLAMVAIESHWTLLPLAIGAVLTAAQLKREKARREREARVARWYGDPVLFAREALGVELWDAQISVAIDVAGNALVAVRSGHKVGKSTLLCCLALWWAVTRPRALVILTSGNAQQVRVVLWRELSRLYRGALFALGGKLHKDPATGLVFDDGRLVVGITASEPERFAGYSSPEIFIAIDEASGFDDALLETALGNLAGGGRMLLTGNPTRTTGLFARVFRERLASWKTHHIPSTASPNVAAGRIVVPGLAALEWIAQMAADFGVESAAYFVRVLGDFAIEGDDAVVPLALVEASTTLWTPQLVVDAHDPLEIGVDPARFGDDETIVQGRRGLAAMPALALRKLDGVEVAMRVMAYAAEQRRGSEHVTIRVDVGGIGASVYDHLSRAKHDRMTVVAVNSSSAPRHARFLNTRAELAWCTRQWLKRGGALPPDSKRDGELLAMRYFHNAAMRLQIESKDDLRKRLGRSPDRADALALALYSESPLDPEIAAARGVRIVQPKIARAYEGGGRVPRSLAELSELRRRGLDEDGGASAGYLARRGGAIRRPWE